MSIRSNTVMLTVTVVVGLLSDVALAHKQYPKVLVSKYKLRSVSCSMCHANKNEVAEADLEEFKKNSRMLSLTTSENCSCPP